MNTEGSSIQALFATLPFCVWGSGLCHPYYNLILTHQGCLLEAESKGLFLKGMKRPTEGTSPFWALGPLLKKKSHFWPFFGSGFGL